MEARPDHKASFDASRGFLEVNDVLPNLAIKALMDLYPSKYAIARDQGDKRKRWLLEVPKIVKI